MQFEEMVLVTLEEKNTFRFKSVRLILELAKYVNIPREHVFSSHLSV